MNSYVTLDHLKSSGVLDVEATDKDTRFLRLLENISRQVDRYCRRFFYVFSGTKKFDGDGGNQLRVPDLIAVTTLKDDDDMDRVFENTWASADYLLLPTNADPANAMNPDSRPYHIIEADPDGGNKSAFPSGRQSIEVTGKWGYWEHLTTATEKVSGAMTAAQTTLTVNTRADVEAGHTILVGSEQMYVKAHKANVLTVVRGVNGTTAGTHNNDDPIKYYEYPGPIVEAVIIQTARLFKRKDSAFADSIGFPDGGTQVFRGFDPDVKQLLAPYRIRALKVISDGS